MCGIAAIKCFGTERPTIREVKHILKSLEVRGTDATGIAFLTKKGIRTQKGSMKASKFIKKQGFRDLLREMPNTLLMHTRNWTKGKPTNSLNNHPITAKGSRLALVHNGMIKNDDFLFDTMQLKRQAEVDSEVILRLFEKENGNFEKGIQLAGDKLAGTCAFALLNSKHPTKLLVGRSNNPLEMLFDDKRNILFLASIKIAFRETLEIIAPTKKWYGFYFSKQSDLLSEVKADTALLIGSKGIEKEFKFNLPYSAYGNRTYPVENFYTRRDNKTNKEWEAEFDRKYPHHCNTVTPITRARDRYRDRSRTNYPDYHPTKPSPCARGGPSPLKIEGIQKWVNLNSGEKHHYPCSRCGIKREVKRYNETNEWFCIECFGVHWEFQETTNEEMLIRLNLKKVEKPKKEVKHRCYRCNQLTSTEELQTHTVTYTRKDEGLSPPIAEMKMDQKLCIKCIAHVEWYSCTWCGQYPSAQNSSLKMLPRQQVYPRGEPCSMCEPCARKGGFVWNKHKAITGNTNNLLLLGSVGQDQEQQDNQLDSEIITP